MTPDVAERLRTLAKDYSRGHLSFEAYRRERTSLLDSLDAPPPEGAPPLRLRLRLQLQLQRARPLGIAGLAIAAGAIVIALSWYWVRNTAPERQLASAPRQPGLAAAPDRIQGLIAPLLNDPVWDDARVAAVNEALLEEGPRRIAARRQTEWFQRFAAEIRRHQKQQQSSTLDALAVTIGLDPDDRDEPP